MLQISHTENPMCSATIDQIKLRRAVTLPLVSQKVGSSGFQSEIQIGSFEVGSFEIGSFELIEISFVQSKAHRVAIRGHGNAFRAKPGEAVANSDERLFGDGIDGVGKSYSSFVPSPRSEKICYFINAYVNTRGRISRRGPHSKFAPAH